MYKPLSEFSFLEKLVKHKDEVSKEFFDSAKKLGFLDPFDYRTENTFSKYMDHWTRDTGIHREQTGSDYRNGLFIDLPLYKDKFPIKDYNPKEVFPITIGLLEEFLPKIEFACFVRTGSLSTISEHVHAIQHDIFHMLLNDLENGFEFIVNKESKILKNVGDYLIFDYTLPHATRNLSHQDRFGLLIDLK